MPSAPPRQADSGARRSGLRWNAWNLLLLVPLLMLITSWFNLDQPRLLGMPFFYWYQFAFVPVGVICVGLVYLKTRDEPVRTDQPDRLGVDDLDEGGKA
ncbi:DUF3311 domain-containing protein [Goodfellowiella coeruleoviolacea]|uniref:DUF3311 domain-containing protein n=1 Tax=Goodfellowiella coeruleoviolacea TaxID=334858 RepID=A0AAE3GDJ9_9PSEU|nr:DUF3311 domain-containing protein [Goodfellowiella coeruleoviolacea]MCP2166246.1 Protein of unknown function (DUF3311) [Goodfellowiella coeruleoviolacea]